MKQMIFLLGGYDLEMVEIRNLLKDNKIVYFDKQLNWENALLSQYAGELTKYAEKDNVCIYGIELRETGIAHIPDNYYRIDHHNDYNHKASSLEQVAEILGVQLTRYQQLVAANDSGYIPGMQAFNATAGEIDEIRRKDRAIQGVTEEDEQLAEKAIREKVMENGIIVVKAYSSRFSPICDRLFPYDKLLIYTDDELMYYGAGKKLLVEKFAKEIEDRKMFHGGGDNGYLGCVKGGYSKKEIEKLKKTVINQ